MSALGIHLSYEFRAGVRSPSMLLLNYLFPLAFYLLMGLVMIPLNPDFSAVLIPAMTLFAALTPTVLGLPGPLVEAREAGILRGYRVNGIPTVAILGVPAATTALHALIAATVIGLSAPLLFDVAVPSRPVAMVAVVLLAVFVFAALGSLFGVVSTDSRMTIIWSQAVFLPSMLIGGMMVPVDLLPQGMQPISFLLPTTHLMQLAEGWAFGRPTIVPPGWAAAALVATGLVASVQALRGFSWEPGTHERRLHPALALLVFVPLAVVALTV